MRLLLFFLLINSFSYAQERSPGKAPRRNTTQRSEGLKQRQHFESSGKRGGMENNGTSYRHMTWYRFRKEHDGFTRTPNFYRGRNKKKGLY